MFCVTIKTQVYKGAFTLLEVMLSVVVLSIIILGAQKFSDYSLRLVSEQGMARMALNYATRQVERVKADDYGNYLDQVDGVVVGSSYVYLYDCDPTASSYLFLRSTTDPEETVAIGGLECPITTKVRMVSTGVVGSAQPGQFMEIVVKVVYANFGESNERYVYLTNRHTFNGE